MEIFSFTLLFLMTIAAGYFSASEVALFSLSSHKIQAFSQSSNSRLKTIAELLRYPQDLLVTVFMLNTLINILLQNSASSLFQHTSGWTFKVGVPFILTLLFAEILPKYIALKNNVSLATKVAPSISWIQRLLAPIRRITIAITSPISQLLFFFLKREPPITKQEVLHALSTATNQAVLSKDERELIQGYLNLVDATVKELMRPKQDILYFDIQSPLSKLVHLFTDEKCSRVPVCDGHIDNILGVFSASQFFVCKDRIQDKEDLLPLLQKPFYVPEITLAKTLLKRFYLGKESFALVIDEYGSLSGLMTLEDLAEEVIGQVSDLRDQKSFYTVTGKNEIIASGHMELSELNHLFQTYLTSESVTTVGGWLTEQLDGFPQNGTKLEKDDLFFHILSVSPRKIERVYIRKKKPSPPSNKRRGKWKEQ